MKDETHGRIERGWDNRHRRYTCWDGSAAVVPYRTASIRDLDGTKTAPSNRITYGIGRKELEIVVSGVEFDRCMTTVFGGPDDIRTIIFPKMVRTVRQGAFHGVKSLRAALLNEGLETLGTDEYKPDGERYPGVFQESGLKRVKFPSTLKRIEYTTFMDCERLRVAHLPDKLEYIGGTSFSGTGLESVEFPASVRTIC